MAHGSRLISIAAAAFIAAQTADATELAELNAYACGVNSDALSTAVDASAAGSRAYRDKLAQLATGMDRDIPAMVKLQIIYEKSDRIEVDHCGGAVIDSRWVVTAAHCVAADSGWDRIDIYAGDADLDSSGVIKRTAHDAICHAGFEYSVLDNDIALIRLDEPLPSEVLPARMDSQRRPSTQPGDIAYAAGWPVTGHNAGDKQLNKTALHVSNVDWPGFITVSSPRGMAEGVCRGESGGPLMSRGPMGMQLAGVLSGIQPGTQDAYGDECMLGGYEMYFTPIAAYRNWIENVQSHCDARPGGCKGAGSSSYFIARDDSVIWPVSASQRHAR